MINSREDWIKAGLDMLQSGGHRSVKIEALARKLGVSKGGFYGYFINREAFLQAMLDYWETANSIDIFDYIYKQKGDLSFKLQKLLYLVDDDKYDSLEVSMFYWAAIDPSAKKVVMRVIEGRLDFVNKLLLEGGFSQEEAERRGHIVHHYMAGCRPFRALLPKSGSPERQAQLDRFIKLVIARVEK